MEIDLKHICLLRLSALGDVTHVLPVVNAIRHRWPYCKITWIIGSFEKKLIPNLHNVEFITFNKKHGLAEYRRLFSLLSRRRFDALLHMQLSLRANVIASMVNAPIKIGFDRRRSKEGHTLVVSETINYEPNQHVLDAFMSFLKPLGIQNPEIKYELPISNSVIKSAQSLIPFDEHYAVISPASSHALRNWTAEGYAAVADHIITKHGLNVLLCGGKSQLEMELGNAIEGYMQCQPYNIIGKDTVEQMVALLDRATFLISPDSGPAHIANAVGTPVLGLYAATDPQRSGPYHSRQWCIDGYAKAAQKFLGKNPSQLNWGKKIEVPGVMSLIHSNEVIAMADRLLSSLSD